MRTLLILGLFALAGCSSRPDIVFLKHQQTRATVQCGPYYAHAGAEAASAEKNRCIAGFKAQGYEPIPD